MKRKEDQEKLKEFERNKIQLQTLLEYKHEMTQAHRVVQDENEELKRVTFSVLCRKKFIFAYLCAGKYASKVGIFILLITLLFCGTVFLQNGFYSWYLLSIVFRM